MADEFTVEIARDGGAPPNSRTYSVVFRANGVRESAEHLRRCRSDYALLRVIEELVAAPEARLELLGRLHVRQRYAVTPAPCSVCHKLRVAIRALPDPDA